MVGYRICPREHGQDNRDVDNPFYHALCLPADSAAEKSGKDNVDKEYRQGHAQHRVEHGGVRCRQFIAGPYGH